jgi:hypothetical protein
MEAMIIGAAGGAAGATGRDADASIDVPGAELDISAGVAEAVVSRIAAAGLTGGAGIG